MFGAAFISVILSWSIQPARDSAVIRAAASFCIDEFETLQLPMFPLPGWEVRAREEATDQWTASRESLLAGSEPHELLVALRDTAEQGRFFEGVDDGLLGFAEIGLLPAPPEKAATDGDQSSAAVASSSAEPPLFPYLANLAVKPGARRLGLGQELVEATERTAAEMGYDRLYIKVDRQNFDARRLYDRLGYRLVYLQPRTDPRKGPTGANLFLRKDGVVSDARTNEVEQSV